MTNTSFQPGDYIQPIGSSKIFFVKSIIEKGIVIERVDEKETARFFVGRAPIVINFDEIGTKFKFAIADQSNEQVQKAIETYEIDKIIGDESFEEMCSHF